MGVLTKEDIIKRIINGEKLIYAYLLNENGLDDKVKKNLEDLKTQLDKVNVGEERELKDYFKRVGSDINVLAARRAAIKTLVTEYFIEREKSDINKRIEELETDRKIKLERRNKDNAVLLPIFIDNPDYDCIRGANYDLRLGEDVYVTTEKVPKKLTAMGADGVVSIEPGEFGILMAHEYIFVPPDLMGFISIRLTFKQKGLVNISGFHVDPGFYGRLMFAVFNSGPNDVPLRYNERVFMIMFSELSEWVKVKKSPWHGMETIPIETMFGLRGTSVSVRNLDERVRRLELLFPVVLTGVVSVVVAVIAWVLTHWRWW